MSSDALDPGEIDLEAPAPAAPVATVVDTPATEQLEQLAPDGEEPEPEPEPAAVVDPPAPARRAPSGAVAELIALRKEKKDLAQRLHQFESSPVLQRLTPDVQAAILEGRLQIAPPQGSREAETTRLTEVAETLQLYKVDANNQTVPDLDAARRVDKFVRGTVQDQVAPMQHATLAEKAQGNIDKAVAYAAANGLDVDIVRDEFLSIASQPNGAHLLSQAKIAKQVWRGAVGRMHEEGKLTAKEAKKAAAAVPSTPAIVTEAPGRRAAAGTAIQLSPGLARVYKEAGVDPAKSFTATRTTPINYNGPIDLED